MKEIDYEKINKKYRIKVFRDEFRPWYYAQEKFLFWWINISGPNINYEDTNDFLVKYSKRMEYHDEYLTPNFTKEKN
jgi:hypothetical protein